MSKKEALINKVSQFPVNTPLEIILGYLEHHGNFPATPEGTKELIEVLNAGREKRT